ncbi:MAG: PQQ-dependent sugar dehydrogenase [Alphaproteobacteria bacterium]|nr:PQQ-dependent sugar dehydrogenase [Alphaproteobacteria bacterium]
MAQCTAVVVSLLTLNSLAFGALAAPGEQPGQKFSVRVQDLPKPYATEAVDNSAEKIARPAGATLSVPKGFKVDLFAEGIDGPRNIAITDDGYVLVALSKAGKIAKLRDTDNDGRADESTIYADGFTRPFGLAYSAGTLYVGDTKAVWRLPYRTTRHGRGPLTPADALGEGRGHWTRNLALGPDFKTLFVAVGSRDNIAEESDPRATIQTLPIEGGALQTFARGLRNPVGLAVHPSTGDLYTVVNERDGLGDGLVPDYFTRVARGAFYGWPYAYLGANPDPDYGSKNPDLVAATQTPEVLFQAHSAPIGLAFYNAKQFPARFNGGAFVALHGSWNSGRPTGYKVVFVPFANGRPAANEYENFATGFWASGVEKAQVWGRPAGLAVAQDGALLVADDTGNAIWRISYQGTK